MPFANLNSPLLDGAFVCQQVIAFCEGYLSLKTIDAMEINYQYVLLTTHFVRP